MYGGILTITHEFDQTKTMNDGGLGESSTCRSAPAGIFSIRPLHAFRLPPFDLRTLIGGVVDAKARTK
jgi:hypothetical protein